MKYLLLTSALLAFFPMAFAGDQMEKIDTDFGSLDNNNDQYVSQEEADDNNIGDHFSIIDTNQDGKLSKQEYVAYLSQNPGVIEEGENLIE